MKVKKNDTVVVIAGKDKGKQGKVLVADPKANKVTVDGINVQMRHSKARSAKTVSEIKRQSGPVDASNVMVICPKCGKATRVGYSIDGDNKNRICKKCGAVLDVKVEAVPAKAAKAEKKATKKSKAADESAKAE